MVLRVSVVRLAISLMDKCSRKNIRRILAYMTMVITSYTPAHKISRILVLPGQNSTRITALIWSILNARQQAALYKDENSRRILKTAADVEKAFQNITHKDKRSGVVYIVTTLSDNPALKVVPNLFKIGYTESTVEERTKNAERDIAFLESPIRIVASIECFNLNPHRFESLIHGFLSAQRLTIELTGKNGQTYRPKEWFSVPLDSAREVVRRIIDGTIIQYRMDNTTCRIQPKLRS